MWRALKSYRKLLRYADHWFSALREKQASRMQCRRGCALCCLILDQAAYRSLY